MKTYLVLLLLMLPAVWADVQIHQVLYDPLQTESGGEFIQLYNDDLYPVDISGWVIQTSSSARDAVFPDTTIIPGESYFLIADVGWSEKKDDPSWPNATYEEIITMKNSDSGIALHDGNSIVDAVGWGNAAEGLYEGTPALDVAAGKSLLRVQDTNDNAEDFIESDPQFISGNKGSADIEIRVQVISANVSFSGIDITDNDLLQEGIQIMPQPGTTKQVPISVHITSSLPVDVKVHFDNKTFLLNKVDDTTYTGFFEVPYVLSPDMYDVTLTAETGFSFQQQKISVEVLPLVAFSVDTGSIYLGNTTPGSTLHVSGDTDMGTQEHITLQNLGNTVLDFGVYGTDLVSDVDTILVSSLSFGLGDELITLDENNQVLELGLEAGALIPINLELIVPEGVGGGMYTGTVTLVGIGE